MTWPILTPEQIHNKLSESRGDQYLACFNSWLGGYTTEMGQMLVPLDDHLVHRGDGVFEAIKVVSGRIYLLDEHLLRMESSAKSIGLKLFQDLQSMREIVQQTWALAQKTHGLEQGLLRIFLSRGPGSFSTNPYDTLGSQFFVVATKLKSPSQAQYANGVRLGRSAIPVKSEWMAQIKSCNYLPNVMMKKESVDRSLDFTIAFDEHNFVAESSTENLALVSERGYLVKPKLNKILKGCTMTRVFELANELLGSDGLLGLESRNISEAEIFKAREVFMLGTTLDVLPVTEYENRQLGSGKVGPLAQKLQALLLKDQNLKV